MVWGLGFPGLVILMLLLTGFSWTSGIGGRIGRIEVRLDKFNASIVSVGTSICLVIFVMQHLAWKRVMHMATTSITAIELQDRYLKDKFRSERNWWLSIVHLLIWASAWRLTILQEVGLLQPWTRHKIPRISWRLRLRGAWLLLAVMILLIGDLPVSRVNYWFQISANITPNKIDLVDQYSVRCKDVRLDNCTSGKRELCPEGCNAFCQNVRILAEERQSVVHWVRNSHVTGKWGAELFDKCRGVENSAERIDDLFSSKTCLKVLESVDKSNFKVNAFCMTCAVVICLLFVWALAHVLEGLGGPVIPLPPALAPGKEDTPAWAPDKED